MTARLFTLNKEQDAQNEEFTRRMSPLNFRGGFNELISWTKATRPVKPDFNIIGINSDTRNIEYWNGVTYVEILTGDKLFEALFGVQVKNNMIPAVTMNKGDAVVQDTTTDLSCVFAISTADQKRGLGVVETGGGSQSIITVRNYGTAICISGGAILPGDLVTVQVNGSGRVVTDNSNIANKFGRAVSSTTGAGQQVTINIGL